MRHIARKRFGQHFLRDQAVITRIVAEVDPRPGQALVEIGPGLGALTTSLLERCGALTVIEVDRDLAATWQQRSGLRVIQADVLTVDIASLQASLAGATGDRLRLVGNLPYNISSPILFHLLPWADLVVDQHFMLQREVVDRMVAGPGSRSYGRLSVMLQWRYAMERLMDVPPQAFDPPPAVESAVVRMTPLEGPLPCDPALLGQIVTLAFSQRRKLLRHTLGRWLQARPEAPAFDTQRRAEEVSVEEYVGLAKALFRPQP